MAITPVYGNFNDLKDYAYRATTIRDTDSPAIAWCIEKMGYSLNASNQLNDQWSWTYDEPKMTTVYFNNEDIWIEFSLRFG